MYLHVCDQRYTTRNFIDFFHSYGHYQLTSQWVRNQCQAFVHLGTDNADPSGDLTFKERLDLNTPALQDLSLQSTWTDEEEDDGEMEPLTHNKVDVAREEIQGLNFSLLTLAAVS